MRTLSIGSVFLALASALMLYSVNYDTRTLERQVHAVQKKRDQISGELAVMRAERAYLARPDLIEKHARDLGMRPLDEKQLVDSLRPEFLHDNSTVITGSTK